MTENSCVFVQKQERTGKSWQVIRTQLGLARGRVDPDWHPSAHCPHCLSGVAGRELPAGSRGRLSLAGLPVRDSVCSPHGVTAAGR